MKFKDELKETINLLLDHPLKYRKSIYFNNENIRDMTYKKYTIIYRVKPRKNEIEILRIFNSKRGQATFRMVKGKRGQATFISLSIVTPPTNDQVTH